MSLPNTPIPPYRSSPLPEPFDIDAACEQAMWNLRVHIANMSHSLSCDVRAAARELRVAHEARWKDVK